MEFCQGQKCFANAIEIMTDVDYGQSCVWVFSSHHALDSKPCACWHYLWSYSRRGTISTNKKFQLGTKLIFYCTWNAQKWGRRGRFFYLVCLIRYFSLMFEQLWEQGAGEIRTRKNLMRHWVICFPLNKFRRRNCVVIFASIVVIRLLLFTSESLAINVC